jgi:hypothetical protein
MEAAVGMCRGWVRVSFVESSRVRDLEGQDGRGLLLKL